MKKLSTLVSLGLILSACEQFPSGHILTEYKLKKCIQQEAFSKIEELPNDFEIEKRKNNSCIFPFKYERGGFLSAKKMVHFTTRLSQDGCRLDVLVPVSRYHCNPKFENYNQRDCDEALHESEAFRDSFLKTLSEKINLEIDTNKTKSKLIEDEKYELKCKN